jgi:hypothetical protein
MDEAEDIDVNRGRKKAKVLNSRRKASSMLGKAKKKKSSTKLTRSKKIQKHVQVCQKNTKEKQETHSVVFVSDSEDSPGTIHEPVVVEGSTISVQKEVHKKKTTGND